MIVPPSPGLAASAVLEIRGGGWNVAIASDTANCAVATAPDDHLVEVAGDKALLLRRNALAWVTELATPGTDIITCTREHVDVWTDLQVYRLLILDGSVV
ncbi:MAG: hypothetical protein M3P91_01840 [Actinomycetota bacterium]|nr:hypothetical protein [Actinomycetota bacterium]